MEQTGGRSPTEPVGWSNEAQPEERSPEGSTPDQGGAGGTREPGGMMGDSGGEGARSRGGWRWRCGILQRCWRIADPRDSHRTDRVLRAGRRAVGGVRGGAKHTQTVNNPDKHRGTYYKTFEKVIVNINMA